MMTGAQTTSAAYSPAASFTASLLAAIIFIGVCILSALHLADGGFEILAATLVGAVVGMHATSGSPSRFERLADASFAGMWISIMVSGLLHEPLARLAQLAIGPVLN